MAKSPKTVTVARGKGKTAQISNDVIIKAGDSFVSSADGTKLNFTIATHAMNPMLREIAKVGGSMRAVELWLAEKAAGTKLARGLDGRNAPHSAAAVQDAKRKLAAIKKPAAKATPAKATAAKATAAKATAAKATAAKATAAKATPAKADDATVKITVLDKAFTFGAEGTGRAASWSAARTAKTVAAYIAAGGARKYLARWVAAGAINLG